jgi:hypothetical protein
MLVKENFVRSAQCPHLGRRLSVDYISIPHARVMSDTELDSVPLVPLQDGQDAKLQSQPLLSESAQRSLHVVRQFRLSGRA